MKKASNTGNATITTISGSLWNVRECEYKGVRARIMRKIRSCKPFMETLSAQRGGVTTIERKNAGTVCFTVAAGDGDNRREVGFYRVPSAASLVYAVCQTAWYALCASGKRKMFYWA